MLGNLFGYMPMYGGPPPVAPPPVPPEVASLVARVDALELTCCGLWQLLKTKYGYTDNELLTIVHDIDARDGTVDGRMSGSNETCPSCGRKLVTKQRHHCVWCGAALGPRPFEGPLR